MNFSQFCIRRPAFTIVLSLLITIVGIISYTHLPLRWVPDTNLSRISIYTEYPGASSSLVESQITTPIESVLSGVDGIEAIYSNSRQGSSNINIDFKLGHNMSIAIEDVRNALERFNASLPTDANAPTLAKANSDDNATLYLAFFDTHRSAKEVSDYVEQFIMPRLQTVDGVASVLAYGERVSAMRIWLDPAKMAAANVTVDEVDKVLKEQNVSVPSGQIRGAQRFYNVVTNQTLQSATQFNDLIIRDNQNQIVRLKDIGIAVVDAANVDSAFRVRGQPSVALGIMPQSTANPLDVSRNVLKEFSEIKKTLPAGMQADVVFNQADFISASIYHVYESLFEAIILVLLVILLFLASIRAAIIPIITIPICLIGTFTLLYCCGFSVNTITLMALVLGIGLVVDDAIVMLENISRYIEAGMAPFSAALKGSKEIVFPIIAMTITLAAVYAPIAFTSGLLGSVFLEFALTLAGTVIISGFVALTLTPMMCSRLLAKQTKQHRYVQWVTDKLLLLQTVYQQLLSKILSKRAWVILILAIVGVAGYGIFRSLPAELVSAEDMNEVDAYVQAPRNASFAYTDAYVKQVEAMLSKIPEVKSYYGFIGSWSPTSAFLGGILTPRNQRSRSTDDIVNELNKQMQDLAGVEAHAFAPPPPLTWSSGGHGDSIALKLMSASDYKDLHAIAQQFISALQKSAIFMRVDNQLKWDGEEFEVNIDREKAADMHVSMQNITNTISTLLAGRNAGHFEYGGKQYDVMMQMNESALANPNIISQLYVRSDDHNKMVSLSGLVSMKETTSPEMLPHFNRLRADTIFMDLAPGHTMGEGIAKVQEIAKEVLPDNTKFEFYGGAREFLESNGKMAFTFILALLFIYLVLVAQFESFIDPLIILLTVPFAMIGALAALKLTGCTLNIYSNIGLVTLIGLIAKHGILITEFANRQRLAGKSIQESVIEAAKLRLRPILMTTAAMMLGALPLALATGSGAENRQQIGWVIVGGLLLGTFFSLIVVPVAYTYLAKFKKFSLQESETEEDKQDSDIKLNPAHERL